MELIAHEEASQQRYESLKSLIEDSQMSETRNFFENPYGNSGGASAGGGALGGGLGALIGGAIGSSGGFFGGNRNNEGVVTPDQLQTAIGTVIDNQQNTAVLQGISDVKAAVPLAEGQVQLALAGAVGEVRSHLGAVENSLTAGQAVINKNVSDAIAASLASQNNLNVNILQSAAATREAVAQYGQANLSATKEAQYAVVQAVRDDGDRTRAMIAAQDMATLQRQLTVAETALLRQENAATARGTEINVTQTVLQNQQQAQLQAQQQQQFILLNNLANVIGGLQNAVATNSNLIVGNTGAVATGPQTANPVNVNA